VNVREKKKNHSKSSRPSPTKTGKDKKEGVSKPSIIRRRERENSSDLV